MAGKSGKIGAGFPLGGNYEESILIRALGRFVYSVRGTGIYPGTCRGAAGSAYRPVHSVFPASGGTGVEGKAGKGSADAYAGAELKYCVAGLGTAIHVAPYAHQRALADDNIGQPLDVFTQALELGGRVHAAA